jgi:hypothetical protein
MQIYFSSIAQVNVKNGLKYLQQDPETRGNKKINIDKRLKLLKYKIAKLKIVKSNVTQDSVFVTDESYFQL